MKKIGNVQAKLLNAVAKIGYNSAIKACNTVSYYGCYQPKEPKALRDIRNRK